MNGETLQKKAGQREWLGLGVLILPAIVIAMDLTVLHLAIPILSADLKPSSSQLLWITDIYGFMIAGLLITMGTLGDRIGRRLVLLGGALFFALASMLAAFATTAGMLIAGRAVLGVAGATLMPSTMSLIRNMFHDEKQRTVAIGIWVSGFSVGNTVGPLLGGALLENFSWGSVFMPGVVVMVILLLTGPILLPEYRDPNPGDFDLLSAGLSLAAVLLFIYGLKQVAEHGLDALAGLSAVSGVVLGGIFVRRQQLLADPLIDPGLFGIPAFSVSLAIYMFGTFVNFGIFLLVAQHLQLVLGLSPLQAGFWYVPGAILFIIGSNLGPQIIKRMSLAAVVVGGIVLGGVGLGLLVLIDGNSLVPVVAGITIFQLGVGFVYPIVVDLVVGTVPPERAGAASALGETGLELGGALGLALLGSLSTVIYRSQLTNGIPDGVSPVQIAAAKETLAGATVVAGELPHDVGMMLLEAARSAFMNGLKLSALIGVVVFGVLALIVYLMRHDIRLQGQPAAA